MQQIGSVGEVADKPRAAKPKAVCNKYGWGKTRFYELLNAGKIEARKDGASTLVDLDSAEAYYQSLPKLGRAAA
jgi:hypothetical protein